MQGIPCPAPKKLKDPIYPEGVQILCAVYQSEEPKKTAQKEAIPEFLRYNIVEGDIRNVI